VIASAHERLCAKKGGGGGYNQSMGASFSKIRDTCKELKELSIEHAKLVIAYVKLSASDKAKIDLHNREYYGKAAGERKMEQSGPSEKQLKFLKSLGSKVVPETMLDASKLIDKLMKM